MYIFRHILTYSSEHSQTVTTPMKALLCTQEPTNRKSYLSGLLRRKRRGLHVRIQNLITPWKVSRFPKSFHQTPRQKYDGNMLFSRRTLMLSAPLNVSVDPNDILPCNCAFVNTHVRDIESGDEKRKAFVEQRAYCKCDLIWQPQRHWTWQARNMWSWYHLWYVICISPNKLQLNGVLTSS